MLDSQWFHVLTIEGILSVRQPKLSMDLARDLEFCKGQKETDLMSE